MIGTRVQNFEITSLLGEGGMGSVYIGRHVLIDRRVAVKILRPELSADPALVSRFINEARAATTIRHPNIVDVLDVGTLPSGVPFIIMELLDGESLARRLDRQRPLPLAVALDVVAQAGYGLAAAHEKGIVHRDLKPDNMFLVPLPDGRSLVKVLDFGIAKIRGELGGVGVTSTGALLGTPVYMSPEQCRGVSKDIDQRSDIYSLGLILYEMLCGRPPFVSDAVGDLIVMHATQAPVPPRVLAPEIPEDIERTVLSALEKDKEKRPQTMVQFIEALGAPQPPAYPTPVATPVVRRGPAEPSAGQGVRTPVSATRALPSDPGVVRRRTPTTLSSSAAQIEAKTAAKTAAKTHTPVRGRRGILFAGLGAVALVGVGTVIARRTGTPDQTGRPLAPVATPPPPAMTASPTVATPPPITPPVAAPEPPVAAPPPDEAPAGDQRKVVAQPANEGRTRRRRTDKQKTRGSRTPATGSSAKPPEPRSERPVSAPALVPEAVPDVPKSKKW